MKLYLSSYQLGDQADKLAAMAPTNKQAVVIFNALDFADDLERKQGGINRELNDLAGLGFKPEALDLRYYFGKTELLKEKLNEVGLVWVNGGNTFVLRRAMKLSGLDQILTEGQANCPFVYGGYSAGICVITPSLRDIELVDNPMIVPAGYSEVIIWEGLALINYCLAPHFRSNHPESELIEQTIDYFLNNKILFKALRDGEVIIIE